MERRKFSGPWGAMSSRSSDSTESRVSGCSSNQRAACVRRVHGYDCKSCMNRDSDGVMRGAWSLCTADLEPALGSGKMGHITSDDSLLGQQLSLR